MTSRVPLPARKRGRTVGLILGLLVLVAACGGAASGPDLSTVGSEDQQFGANPRTAPSDEQSTGGSAPGVRDDARIIRTGTMQLQVKDVEAALDRARDEVLALGGYISASRQTSVDDGIVAEITYRIPVDRWEDALAMLRGLALKVLGEETQAAEVTGQVRDLDARIRNLQASERALQGIATQATQIKDVLAVQAELSDVRGQIEQLTAEKGDLVDRADLATMSVTYGVEIVAVTAAAKGWNAGTEVDRAAASLVDLLQAVATAGIWFGIVWLPILIVLVVLVLVVRLVMRRTAVLDRVAAARAGTDMPADSPGG